MYYQKKTLAEYNKMGYIRFLLAACVIFGHTGLFFGWALPGGNIAVEAFFIISGFYIALILNQKYVEDKSDYKLFITNRLLRLLPLYYLLIACRLFYDLFLGMNNPTNIYALYAYVQLNGQALLLFLTINITVVGQGIVHFLGIDNGSLYFTDKFTASPAGVNPYQLLLAPQMWTVSLEILFYLMAPFFLRKPLKFLLMIVATSFLIRVGFYANGLSYDPWSYRFFPLELVFFFSGACMYHLYKRIATRNINESYLKAIYILDILAILFYVWLPTRVVYGFDIKQWFFYLLIAFSIPFVFKYTKNNIVDRFIGDLSYPMYVIHLFIVDVAINMSPNLPHTLHYGATIFFITVIVSGILNETFGIWIEKIRQRNFVKAKVPLTSN
jgi:peptidoglycan/LPS O-acetylase OafA/YrhL